MRVRCNKCLTAWCTEIKDLPNTERKGYIDCPVCKFHFVRDPDKSWDATQLIVLSPVDGIPEREHVYDDFDGLLEATYKDGKINEEAWKQFITNSVESLFDDFKRPNAPDRWPWNREPGTSAEDHLKEELEEVLKEASPELQKGSCRFTTLIERALEFVGSYEYGEVDLRPNLVIGQYADVLADYLLAVITIADDPKFFGKEEK